MYMQELVEKIKELYGLSGVLSTEKVEKGFLSENYTYYIPKECNIHRLSDFE